MDRQDRPTEKKKCKLMKFKKVGIYSFHYHYWMKGMSCDSHDCKQQQQ